MDVLEAKECALKKWNRCSFCIPLPLATLQNQGLPIATIMNPYLYLRPRFQSCFSLSDITFAWPGSRPRDSGAETEAHVHNLFVQGPGFVPVVRNAVRSSSDLRKGTMAIGTDIAVAMAVETMDTGSQLS